MATMRKVMSLGILYGLLLAALAYAQDYASFMAQGDQMWLARSGSDEKVIAAIKLYEQAAQTDPKQAEPYCQIARGYYFLGRFAPAAKKEELYKKGVAAGEKAIGLNANSPCAHYWYAVCLAKSLENKSVVEKLKYKSKMESNLEFCRKSDPKYYYGGPDRVIGMVAFKNPLANNSMAIEHLRQSLKLYPDYSLTLVNLAEVLIKEKQYAEAEQLCKKTLTLTPMKGFERELADDQAQAKKLLASIPK